MGEHQRLRFYSCFHSAFFRLYFNMRAVIQFLKNIILKLLFNHPVTRIYKTSMDILKFKLNQVFAHKEKFLT